MLVVCVFFLAQAQTQTRSMVGADGGFLLLHPVNETSEIGLNPSCLDVPQPNPRSIIQDVDGYPFLVVGWGKGHVESKGMQLECDGLNLLLYNQQLWIKSEGKVIAIEPNPDIEAVIIEGRRIVPGLLPEQGSKLVWVEELATGNNAMLYKHHTATFVGPQAPVNSYDSGSKAKFTNKSNLYLNIAEGDSVQLLPEKAAAFLALLPQNAEEMKTFLSKNKINLKKEADVIKAVAYYNSL